MALKDKYFTISEAAQEFGVTRQTISRWVASGKIPAEKIGRETLIEKTQLERHEDDRLTRSIRGMFASNIIRYLREVYGYTNEDAIQLLGTKRWGAGLAFSVTKKDGTCEKVSVDMGKIEVSEDGLVSFEIRGVKKKRLKR